MNWNAEKWVDALESGEFEQCQYSLKKGDSYCCLGVACEIYRRETGKGKWEKDEFILNSNPIEFFIDNLPLAVRDWLGLSGRIGTYELDGDKSPERCLSEDNDTGASFIAIAKTIRSNPRGLFNE